MEDYLWDLQNKLSPSEYQYYEDIYKGRTGIPIELFVSADEHASNTPRTQQEARCIEGSGSLLSHCSGLFVGNRQKWLG